VRRDNWKYLSSAKCVRRTRGKRGKEMGYLYYEDVDYTSVERRGDNATFVANGPAWFKCGQYVLEGVT
jgi:hypothetical protein